MDSQEEPTAVVADQVCLFYLEDRCRFGDQCRNLHPVELAPAADLSTVKRKTNTVKKIEDDKVKKESLRMRTASDAIHRIVWDPALNASDFQVIYLDRFTGHVAIPLTEFLSRDADDPCSIPQHRIQQIHYNPSGSSISHVVWDKQTRTDHIFGSSSTSGCNATLFDIIQSVNESIDGNLNDGNHDR